MTGENQQLVTDEPVEFEKYLVEVLDSRKNTDSFYQPKFPTLEFVLARVVVCN